MKIPFCKTTLGAEEKQAISEVIDSGWVVMGDKTIQFEEEFAKYVGSKFAIFVDSGTSALFLAVKCLQEFQGHIEEMAVPSLTFTSTAEVLVNAGIKPKFVDVELGSPWNLKIPENDKIKYSLPVHLMGNRSQSPAHIYDSAHRIERGDVPLSSAIWCYSFYATKNLTTIQGGMIATNNENYAKWLKAARDHGLTQGTKERYEKSSYKYNISFVGFREKSDDVHAAIGLAQLKKLDWMNEARNTRVQLYNDLLGLQNAGNHLYPVLVNERPKFVEFMCNKGIQVSVHFLPLHKMTAYRKYAVGVSLPNTDFLGERLVSLPLFPAMTDEEVKYVADAVLESGLVIKQ